MKNKVKHSMLEDALCRKIKWWGKALMFSREVGVGSRNEEREEGEH